MSRRRFTKISYFCTNYQSPSLAVWACRLWNKKLVRGEAHSSKQHTFVGGRGRLLSGQRPHKTVFPTSRAPSPTRTSAHATQRARQSKENTNSAASTTHCHLLSLIVSSLELTRPSKLAVLLHELEGDIHPLRRVERQLRAPPVSRQYRHSEHPLRDLRQLEVHVRRKRYR